MTEPDELPPSEELARLRERERELARSNGQLQQLMHMAAHDLLSALYAVTGCTQLLRDECAGKLEEPAATYLALAQENTRRLQTLVQDLQAYGRIDTKPLVLEATDLNRVIGHAVGALAGPIAEARADLRCGDLPTLPVDRVLIAQVFLHLIGNGIKFRQPDRPLQMEISAERQGGEWLFAVSDNGIGIDARYHGQIFDFFRRLHSYQTYPGTGLGLSTCRRIVERHGGRIWVESRLGEGSTFRVALPAGDGSPGQDA